MRDQDSVAVQGRFHEFTLDEAIAIAKRNDPGDKVPSVSRTLLAEINRLQSQQDGAQGGEAVGYAVFARSEEYFAGPIRIPGYFGSMAEVRQQVMAKAMREGFKGDYVERMAELGWWLEPLYTRRASAPQEVSLDFPGLGRAGPFGVAPDSGCVTLPDATMNDLAHYFRQGYAIAPQATPAAVDDAMVERVWGALPACSVTRGEVHYALTAALAAPPAEVKS